jgi:hypothetical protein
LVAACRKVSCHAAVAWSKRNVLRNIRTQENCGSRKELAAAGRMMTRVTGVARHKGHGSKKQTKDDAGKGTQKERTDEKRRRKFQECKNGISDRGMREQLQGSKRKKGSRRQTAATSEEKRPKEPMTGKYGKR